MGTKEDCNPFVDVSVVIVAYNSASCIRNCLQSIAAQQGADAEMIVVDNASADGTTKVVRRWGGCLQLIENRENVGFGRANNQGFAASRGRMVYLLNPDAQLIQGDGLVRLCRAVEAHPRWGLAGTRVISADGQSEAHPAKTYPGQRHVHRDFDTLRGEIAWVIGASMFFRRETYESLGGFDPGFFLYSEETDLCLRAREKGWEIGFVEDVAVRHIGGASEDQRDPYEVWLRRMHGLHRFWAKHYPRADVARLVRRDRLRARYRMVVNGLLARLQPPGSSAWQKQRRYQAVWETASEFLAAQRFALDQDRGNGRGRT